MNSDLTTAITALSILALSQQNLPAASTSEYVLATHQMSLENRHEDTWVNNIFKENILLNMAYLRGSVASKSDINWDEVKKPFIFEFKLNPGQVFAYHSDVFEKYEGKVVKTTNAHFNFADGFKSSGKLFGDGICHLASLIYWVAKDALLDTEAPTNHDFAPIPDIPKEMGVSIYYMPDAKGSNARQNLYITNNRPKPVTFKFEYKQSLRPDGLRENNLKVSAVIAD